MQPSVAAWNAASAAYLAGSIDAAAVAPACVPAADGDERWQNVTRTRGRQLSG
jgi:hypothetical protein